MRFGTTGDLTSLLRLASRNVWRQKARAGMALGAIAFGVVAMILSGGFVQDLYVQLGEAIIHSQSGHLQIARSGYFGSGSRSPEKYVMTALGEERERVAAHREVLDVMARVSFTGLLNNGRADMPVIGEGVEPGKEAALGTYLRIVEGRGLEPGDRDGALLGQGVAKALNLRPGDTATVVVSTGGGAMNTLDVRVVGLFQSFSRDYDARAVRVPLEAAQGLLDTPGANVLVVSLRRTGDTDAVAARLSADAGRRGLEVKTWQALNDFYPKTVELYDRQFGVLQLIIFAMVLLSVTNTVNMAVFERTGEFGTMRAVGNTGTRIFGLVMCEGVLLGLAGAALGVLAGVGLAIGISAVGIPMPPPPNSNLGYTASIRVVPHLIASAFITGWAATVLASVLPGWRVSRIPVVDALRQNV